MYNYLIVYILGIFTIPIITKLVLPLLKKQIVKWAEGKQDMTSIFHLGKPKKREGCPECGSSGRHRKECSRGKKK
jgi:hypothetical protein